MEVVADDDAVEAVLFRRDAEVEELARPELLRGRFPSECQHPVTLSAKLSVCPT